MTVPELGTKLVVLKENAAFEPGEIVRFRHERDEGLWVCTNMCGKTSTLPADAIEKGYAETLTMHAARRLCHPQERDEL